MNDISHIGTGKSRSNGAYTLSELVLTIMIIAVLAAMILPLFSKEPISKRVTARREMADIVIAINQFESDYGRFPITTNEQIAAGTNDFTTGMMADFGAATRYSYDNNSNVMAILMDLEYFPNGDATANLHHSLNLKQNKYLHAKFSGYDPRAGGKPLPGVDNNGVYRDPWGNPYVITVDLNSDNQCNDLLYSLATVSRNPSASSTGFHGLSNPDFAITPDNFQFHGRVMVWSAGPDGRYDTNSADAGLNKDNAVSWR